MRGRWRVFAVTVGTCPTWGHIVKTRDIFWSRHFDPIFFARLKAGFCGVNNIDIDLTARTSWIDYGFLWRLRCVITWDIINYIRILLTFWYFAYFRNKYRGHFCARIRTSLIILCAHEILYSSAAKYSFIIWKMKILKLTITKSKEGSLGSLTKSNLHWQRLCCEPLQASNIQSRPKWELQIDVMPHCKSRQNWIRCPQVHCSKQRSRQLNPWRSKP